MTVLSMIINRSIDHFKSSSGTLVVVVTEPWYNCWNC